MSISFRFVLVLSLVVGPGTLSAVAGAAAGAESSATHDVKLLKSYASPLTIAPSDLRNSGDNPDGMILVPHTGYLQADNSMIWSVAPVYLPNGARIAYFQASLHDGWDGGFGICDMALGFDVGVYLMRVHNFTGETQQMSFLQSSGTIGTTQHLGDISVEHPDVAYPDWSYYMIVRMCSTAHYFMGATILYTVP